MYEVKKIILVSKIVFMLMKNKFINECNMCIKFHNCNKIIKFN